MTPSTQSKIIPASAIAGESRSKQGSNAPLGYHDSAMADARGLFNPVRLFFKALVTKLVFLALIFAAVPVILYDQFRQAYNDNQGLFVTNSQEQGRLIARALAPYLQVEEEGEPLPDPEALGQILQDLAGGELIIRLLLRPAQSEEADSFYYVASAPTQTEAFLTRERQELARLGVLSRLAPSCDGSIDTPARYEDSDGVIRLVTSITPLTSQAGCWIVLASHSSEIYAESAIGRPYWAAPEVQTAGIIYALMAVTVLAIFVGIWRSLGRFGRLARQIRTRGKTAPAFAEQNDVPELEGVAVEIDRMVTRLQNSSRSLVRASEDNAHAFKTPIAIIRQCLEPLEWSLDEKDRRANRALSMISTSLDRLDGLVNSTRRMGETEAALIDPPQEAIDLSAIVLRLSRDHADSIVANRIEFHLNIMPNIWILGSDELVETIIDNILDNAIGVSPDGGIVKISLLAQRKSATLTVEDQGPGVDPRNLQRIFNRYFSERRQSQQQLQNGGNSHMGLGLWVVHRNVEALGGSVEAENVAGAGLRLTIEIPTVEKKLQKLPGKRRTPVKAA